MRKCLKVGEPDGPGDLFPPICDQMLGHWGPHSTAYVGHHGVVFVPTHWFDSESVTDLCTDEDVA